MKKEILPLLVLLFCLCYGRNNAQEKNLSNLLSKDEMKQVLGGYGGSCGYKTSSGTVYCYQSKSDAQTLSSGGGYWCCESCKSNGGSASYC
jgi:hypothetical protein